MTNRTLSLFRIGFFSDSVSAGRRGASGFAGVKCETALQEGRDRGPITIRTRRQMRRHELSFVRVCTLLALALTSHFNPFGRV